MHTMTTNERLGGQIKQARNEAGLKQTQLADMIGASPRSVKRWEKGDGAPGPRYMRGIITATGKKAAFFFDDEEEAAAALAQGLMEAIDAVIRIRLAAQAAGREEAVA